MGASGGKKARVLVPEWQQSMMTVRLTPAFIPSNGRAQPVVAERIVPVQVGRAEDLVAAVGFVAVVVWHIRTVAGVMNDGDIAFLRIAQQRP
jgi:hypothetical protein